MSILKLAIWDFTGRILYYFVVFITGVILTRLLSATEFGAFGIVVSIISLSLLFVEVGFRSAVIQFQDITQEQLSTIFYINFLLACGLIGLFVISAKFIENFYQVESLAHYIVAASLVFALTALNLVPSGLLQKKLELKKISIINTFAAILSGAIGVFFAHVGYKVWALIIQQISSGFLVLIGTVYFARWLPSLSFNLSSIRELWQYGSKLLLSGMLLIIASRLDTFIIGKIFPVETLGYYNRSQSLSGLVNNFSSATTSSIVFPLVAKMRGDLKKTQDLYKNWLNVISFLSFFLTGILFLTSFDVVIILFTEKWQVVGGYFRIMMATGFSYPVSVLMVNIISARGNSKAFLKLEIMKTAILFPSYLSFFFGDVYLFLVVFGIAVLITLVANAAFLRKEIAISLKEQFQTIFKYGIVAALGIATVFSLTFWIKNIYSHLIVASTLFAGFYLLSSYLLKLSGFFELFTKLSKLYNDKRHANISSSA